MKHSILKTAAALAAAVLTAMSVIPVSAEPAVDTIDTGASTSLTIYKYDLTAAQTAGVDAGQFTADGEKDTQAEAALANYAVSGVEFTYLKVGSINTDSQSGTLQLLYDLPAGIEGILGLSDGGHLYTSDEINAALSSTLTTNNTAAKNSLESYIQNNGGTPMGLTGSDGKTSATNLTVGLYLVVETKVPEEVHTTVNPFFVSLPMTDSTGDYWNYNVTVYPKNQTDHPTINKLVSENGSYDDTATASEGDVLDYRIVSKLPSITSEASYITKYTFVDTLSAGLKYNKDVSIAFYDDEADARNATGTPVTAWPAGSGRFSVSYDDVKNSMTVAMTMDGLNEINPDLADKYIVVLYKATVQSSAAVVLGDDGNPNAVDLTYSRTNTVEENTIKDKANVYSYGINMTKTFSDGKGDPTKVRFILQNTTDGYYVKASGSNGVYYVADGTHGASEEEATVFSPASDGSLKINGLEGDDYSLTEIHTDNGYSLLKEPMAIHFSSTEDTIIPSVASMTGIANPNEDIVYTKGKRASAQVDGKEAAMSDDGVSANAFVDVSVLNTNTFTLPQTGGLGSILFTMGGAVIVILGVVVVTRKRKNDRA